MPAKFVSVAKTILSAAIVLFVTAWILDIPAQLQIELFTEQLLASVLGLSLALTFLIFPLHLGETGEEAVAKAEMSGGRGEATAGILDGVLSLLSLFCCFYIAIRYPQLVTELVYRPWDGVIIASIIVLLVFEATRRVTGLALVLIVLVLMAHAMFGYLLPDFFASRPVSLSRLMVYLGIDTNALLGSTLQIAVIVVVPFIIMGNILSRCGGSDFFADLSTALMGRYRGGAAKVAVVGSAFFGMISGSAVANVASVGTITIPLMKRAGFPPHIAASVEAVGSTGGQVMPPVMGAAAFLMAEYLQVPYASVMLAAIIPSFLYYAALFAQVDLESARLGIRGAPRESLPRLGQVLREGWHFPLPFIALVVGLLWFNLEPEYAALVAIGLLIVLALTVKHKGRRMSIRDMLSAIVSAGAAVVDIIAITAIAGILIGALNLTGVVFSLTQQLLAVSGGSTGLLLVITAFAAFILGLPLPTTGVYIILATLAAPALVQAGLLPMQAHMFVLYHGLLGMVTPPVALAAFAAATIAKSDQWRTGWTATRMSWCSYFIPFLFAYSPQLLMYGSPFLIIASLAVVLLGIFMGTMAVVGYFLAPIAPPFRVLYGAIAVLLMIQPGMFEAAIWLNALGVAAAVAAIAYETMRVRAKRSAAIL
ncbi:MAG TPA: TRAP transporter fused permease subunit [Xanthobacteraceae bacterium]|jgi:TRAP transporter 4TM/12TM fusion protein|nr:TRAP transporter fused permease subunit [Xanthobacteraceae bacterium]